MSLPTCNIIIVVIMDKCKTGHLKAVSISDEGDSQVVKAVSNALQALICNQRFPCMSVLSFPESVVHIP